MKNIQLILCTATFFGLGMLANAATTETDQSFMKKAAIGGMYEVQLGQVAKEKAQSPGVKEFGAMMVTDHSKANEELQTVAKSKSVQLPMELDAKHKAKLEKLSKMSGTDFDKAYVKDMVEDHQKDISEFETASRDGKDADVKAFATKTLPTLRTHLERVQMLEKGASK